MNTGVSNRLVICFQKEQGDADNIEIIKRCIADNENIDITKITSTTAIKIALIQTAQTGVKKDDKTQYERTDAFAVLRNRRITLLKKKLQESGWLPNTWPEITNFLLGKDESEPIKNNQSIKNAIKELEGRMKT
tara:strand:+ start:954 stop:1355 length:402 start_codon:yes stop_codon:yes gene_type:complete